MQTHSSKERDRERYFHSVLILTLHLHTDSGGPVLSGGVDDEAGVVSRVSLSHCRQARDPSLVFVLFSIKRFPRSLQL